LVSRNLRILETFMADYPEIFDWYTPEGACIGYPRYLGSNGVEDFTARLVDQVGVLLMPASAFHSELGATPQDRFRIGFGRRDLPETLTVLRDFLDNRSIRP
jgi:aspartate/methionine/tyrosine aminotransferase